jgi:glycine reductase
MSASPRPDPTRVGPLVRRWFDVTQLRAGEATTLRDGVLEVDLDAVAAAARGPAIAAVQVSVASPGDPVRVANVLDAVVPAADPDAPDDTFRGLLADAPTRRPDRVPANLLGGVAVLSTLDVATFHDPDDPLPASFVDLDGPGAVLSPWGATRNVVLGFEPVDGAAWIDVDRDVRRGTARVARDLALAATAGAEPDREETFALGAADPSLPAVAAIVQFTDEGTGLATYLEGEGIGGQLPVVLDPLDVFDGAVTSGAYDSPAARVPTALLQTSALLRRLLAEHGRTLRFAGVVLTRGYLDDASEKQRMAEEAARLAHEELGADGALVNAYSLGNSHTDTMLTVDACERRGVRTVAILAEEGGLTDHVASADAIVSTGNVLELVPGWTPGRVLGDAAHDPPPHVPVLHYLGASAQTGDAHLRAVGA